jgi:hypothetical protein
MTAQGTEKVSWAENTPKGDNAKPTAVKPRLFSPAALKDLFSKIAEAVTGKPTPTFAARRKRREETGRAFVTALPPVVRRPPPPPIVHATAFLGDVLDWLNHLWNWNQPEQQLDQSSHPAQHYPTLDL